MSSKSITRSHSSQRHVGGFGAFFVLVHAPFGDLDSPDDGFPDCGAVKGWFGALGPAEQDYRITLALGLGDDVAVIRKGPKEAGPGFCHRVAAARRIACCVNEGVIVCHQGRQTFEIAGIDAIVELQRDVSGVRLDH